MTFNEIVTATADRLNLTSAEALTRIGKRVNERYRRITSSVGLQTARRGTDEQDTVDATPRVTFALEKIESIYCTDSGKLRVLSEITYDEWRILTTTQPASGDPQCYAIELAGASSVTVALYPTPGATVVTLTADGLENASTLDTNDVPAFPADFHDALVDGAMADEYAKLDRMSQAQQFEMRYEARVADLRYFLAKSAYLQITQGAHRGSTLPPHRRRSGPML